MTTTLLQCDVTQGIPLASESVQCVVTSPPYWGLRDYGVDGQLGLERTPEEYVSKLVSVFREVRRVLKKDGTVWLNLGDSYNGSGYKEKQVNSPKQMSNRGAQSQRGTSVDYLKPKDLIGIPWRVAFALQADGWWLRSDIIWSKPNPMPESVRDRPTRAHEYLFLLTKSARYYYDADAVAEPAVQAGRVRADRMGGNKYVEGVKHSDGSTFTGSETRNRRSVWEITPQHYRGAHFATFPKKLVEPCILAGSRPGDMVIDPFCGSGTALLVAKEHRREGIGLELNAEYISLAEARLA